MKREEAGQMEIDVLDLLNKHERKTDKEEDEYTGFILIGISDRGLNNTVYNFSGFSALAALEMLKAELINQRIEHTLIN